MKITCFKYADSVFGENYIFKGGSKDRLLPISFCFYLIEYSDKKILVDTGCNECGDFVFENFIKPAQLLDNYGFKPNEITDIIITHAHHDHIACIAEYKNAVIHIQKDEYLIGKNYIPVFSEVNTFDDEYSLNDEIIIKKIGGHTKGSSVVFAGNWIFCSDECYYKESLTEKRSIGSLYNEIINKEFLKKYGNDNYFPLLFHSPELKTHSFHVN